MRLFIKAQLRISNRMPARLRVNTCRSAWAIYSGFLLMAVFGLIFPIMQEEDL